MVYRVLSIDGGGITGVFPASFLASLEDDLDRPIGEFFDLICGTSTGGILAIGLALGMRSKDILRLYEERGSYIFDQEGPTWKRRLKRLARSARHLVFAKHDESRLRKELEKVLGKKRVGDSVRRLVVPAWDPETRSIHIFKTAHHERLNTDYKRLAVDAAMATASAPTYYKVHRTVEGIGLTDGGTWANNPVALGVVEAIAVLGWPRDELRILSVGCFTEVYDIGDGAGLAPLGGDIVRLFMDGQSRGALGMTKLLTSHSQAHPTLYRYCPQVPKNLFRLDDTRAAERLRGMGVSFAREAKPSLHPVFFSEVAPPFDPIYKLKETSQ